MHSHTKLALLAAFAVSAAQAQECTQAGYTFAASTSATAANCCPLPPNTSAGLECDATLTVQDGRLGRACRIPEGGQTIFTLPPGDAVTISTRIESAAGQDSGRQLGGRGVIVKGRMTTPASTTARTCAGSFDARELGIESGSAGQGGQFGFFACIDSAGTSGTFFVAGGGGGAGYAGPDGDLPASNGADAEPVLSDVCSAQRGLTSGSRPFERAGGPGGGCAPAALIGSDGAGGGGGFSGVLAAGTAPSYAIGSPTVFSAPSRSDGSVRFFLECAPYVEPTTTVLETVPATTTIFESGKIIETFTTPATRVVSNQAPAPTVTVDEIISLVTTPATSTRTSTLTSTTGSTKCVQLRLSYPASCCPNTYLDMARAPRMLARALVTSTVIEGLTATTTTVDETVTKEASTPVTTVIVPATETLTVKNLLTSYSAAPTPLATATTINYVKAACRTELAFEQKKCANGPLKVAEQLANIALIKAKKALRSQGTVIVDCGTAGIFHY